MVIRINPYLLIIPIGIGISLHPITDIIEAWLATKMLKRTTRTSLSQARKELEHLP